MKEIYHKENQHLDAANKIRAEAEELGFTNGYLNYGDAPVCKHSIAISVVIFQRFDSIS
jgi:hypothetical protein